MDKHPPPLWFTDSHPSERHGLEQFLDYQRNVMIRKAHGLTAEQLAFTIAPSSISLGWLLAHLSFCEELWFQQRLQEAPLMHPWCNYNDDPEYDVTIAAQSTPAELFDLLDSAIARSRTAIASYDLDDETVQIEWNGENRNVRWVYLHMIEEYARHLGHADLLRESIDGRYGD